MNGRKILFAWALAGLIALCPASNAEAAIPIAKIIKEAVKKVIKAVDLMIQRLQNKTIWLQNAQKVLENKLNELKLTEIAEWTEKHRKLYDEYYQELWTVRNTLASYQRIRDIIQRQGQIVDEYARIWNILRTDERFSEGELEHMYAVYTGIMDESVRNLDHLMVVINSFRTQMSDAKRLELINSCGDAIDQNYYDLREFNRQNVSLSISRVKNAHEIESVKKLYGLTID